MFNLQDINKESAALGTGHQVRHYPLFVHGQEPPDTRLAVFFGQIRQGVGGEDLPVGQII